MVCAVRIYLLILLCRDIGIVIGSGAKIILRNQPLMIKDYVEDQNKGDYNRNDCNHP